MRGPNLLSCGVEVSLREGASEDTSRHAHRKYRVYHENTRGQRHRTEGTNEAFQGLIVLPLGPNLRHNRGYKMGEPPWYAHLEQQLPTHSQQLHAYARFACVQPTVGGDQLAADTHTCLREAGPKGRG